MPKESTRGTLARSWTATAARPSYARRTVLFEPARAQPRPVPARGAAQPVAMRTRRRRHPQPHREMQPEELAVADARSAPARRAVDDERARPRGRAREQLRCAASLGLGLCERRLGRRRYIREQRGLAEGIARAPRFRIVQPSEAGTARSRVAHCGGVSSWSVRAIARYASAPREL